MANPFLYKTILERSEGFYKEKGSKFYGYLFHADSELAFKQEMEAIREIHSTARHFCYAYRFGAKKNVYRVNDDGEPSNSAGAPILGQIQSFDLTNVGIIVVRYFGGTKLGVGGLIHAYKETAKLSVESNTIVEKEDEIEYRMTFEYDVMPFIMDQLKKEAWNIKNQSFENNAVINLSVPISKNENFLSSFAKEKVEIEEL